MLEGALEDARAEAVEDDERQCSRQPGAAVHDELGGDVAAGEEEPRRQAECRPDRETGSPPAEPDRAGQEEAEPQGDRGGMGWMVGLMGADDREGEENEAAEGQ